MRRKVLKFRSEEVGRAGIGECCTDNCTCDLLERSITCEMKISERSEADLG